MWSLFPWQLNVSFDSIDSLSLNTFYTYCKCPSFAWQSAAIAVNTHTHTHTHSTTSSSIENTEKHMQTNIQSYIHSHTWHKRTRDNRTWQAVNAPEARINYNFRFCWQSRQIRQVDWLMDWTNDWRSDGLTDWLTWRDVEFGLKVTYWWPHKRKVRNCQLGNQRKRDIRAGKGTLKPPLSYEIT